MKTKLATFLVCFSVCCVFLLGSKSAVAAAVWYAECAFSPDIAVEGSGLETGVLAAAVSHKCSWPNASAPVCDLINAQLGWCESKQNAANCTGPTSAANFTCHGGATFNNCSTTEEIKIGSVCVNVKPSDGGCKDGCCAGGGGGSSGGAGVGGGGIASSASVGNPIEILTGRKIGTYVDWQSGGEHQLYFTRYYSSQNLLIRAPAYSMLGTGWRSNFDSRGYYASSTGAATTIASAVTMHFAMPNGTELAFRKVSNVWQVAVPSISASTLTWSTRTDVDAVVTTTANSVSVRLPNFETYTYDEKGLLTQILFRDGYSHHLQYSSDGYLSKVIDSQGKSMTFVIDGAGENAGLLTAFATPDAKTYKFNYANRFIPDPAYAVPASFVVLGQQGLSAVIYPDATPATETDNPRKSFAYLQNHKFPFYLTTITDELGNVSLSVAYDLTTGRAIQSQMNGGAESATLVYDDTNSKVTVTNALGRSTVYNYSTAYGSVRRITSVDGVATTNCLASNSTLTYDANGFVNQSTDAEGRVTQTTRNTRGLPETVVAGFGTPSAVTTTQTWLDSRPFLKTQTIPGKITTIVYSPEENTPESLVKPERLVKKVTVQDTTTTTVPYSTGGQQRVTEFTYQSYTQPQPTAFTPPAAALANLPLTIVNANAASLTGWTTVSGTMTIGCQVANPCFTSTATSPTVTQQDILIPAGDIANVDAGKRAATIAWKQYDVISGGSSGVRLVFLNQSGVAIGSLASSLEKFITITNRQRTGPIPVGTRSIRVQMQVNFASASLDDIALTLIANGASTTTPYLTIVNPDALGSALTGWSVTAGSVYNSTAPGTNTAYCNTVLYPCFSGTQAAPLDQISQDILLPTDRITEIDASRRSLSFEWVSGTQQKPSVPNIEVAFLNAANAVILNSTSASKGLVSDNTQSKIMNFTAEVPPLSRKVRLKLNFNRAIAGAGSARTTAITARMTGRTVPNIPVQLLKTVDGPLAGTGDTVTYAYNTKGFVSSVINEVGHVTDVTAHTANGLPTSITDPNGVITTLAYNDRNWLTTISVNPGAAITTIAYDAKGQITRVTEPDGSYLNYSYDAASRVTVVANNTGERVEYGYNLNSDVTASTIKTTSGGSITKQMTMTYDELGRLLKSIGASSQETLFSYDRTDLNTQVKDPRNNLYGFSL